MRTFAVLIVLAAGSAQAQSTHQHIRRPPPLEPQTRCEVYNGVGSGNSDGLAELRLCATDDGGLEGVLQWSSERSGWSQREITGRWEGDHFIGHEVRFIESRPASGWRFCLIDHYDLTRAGTSLAGPYASEACNDHGTFTLTRTSAPVPVVNAPPPPPRQERSFFSCAAVPQENGIPLLVPMIAALALRRRR